MKNAFVLFSALLFFPGSAWALDAGTNLKLVPVSPLPEKILVGDGFVYGLQNPTGAEVPSGLQFEPVSGKDLAKEGFRAIPEKDGIRIHPIRSGPLAFPELNWKSSTGEVIGKSEAFGLQVESLLGEKPEPPPEFLPALKFPFPTWVGVIFGILGLLFLGFAGWLFRRWIRSRKNSGMTPFSTVSVPAKPEAEEALESLARLETENFPARGEFRLHAYRLSEIMKRYLGRRYHFDAPECTTEEIRSQANRFPLGPELRQELFDLLSRLDRVKFAGVVPTTPDAFNDLKSVRGFVERTRSAPMIASGKEDRAVS